ncbi:hypothetical protein HK405_010271, partial [Cladochytrium tenue]
MAGPGNSATVQNPEIFFAAGYSSCFLSALHAVAGRQKLVLPKETAVRCRAHIGKIEGTGGGGFGLAVELFVSMPGVEADTANKILEAAHQSFVREIQDLSPEVKKRVDALLNLQDKHSEIASKFREEVLALEKKYSVLYAPLYEKRAQFVSGSAEPTDQEAHREKTDEDGDQPEARPAADDAASPATGIPEFWLRALKTHPLIAEQITDRDEEALKSLTDIKASYLDGNPGFKLTFTFAENPFFSETTLEKSYYLDGTTTTSNGDIMYDHADG